MMASLLCAAALLVACVGPAAAGVMPAGVVDGHVHLINTSQPYTQYLPWKDTYPKVFHTFSTDDYHQQSTIATEHAVFMEVFGSNYVADLDQVAAMGLTEAKYIQSVADAQPAGATPKISAIIARQPLEMGAGIGAHLDEMIQAVPLFRGIRSTPSNSSGFVAGLRELGKRNGTFDILGSIVDLPAYEFVKAVPEVNFIIDHLGGPNITADQAHFAEWAAVIEKMATLPNCYMKISGVPQMSNMTPWSVAAAKPFVMHAISTFGLDRSFFAGNWFWILNYASLKSWDDGLREMVSDFSDADMKQLFATTATKLYRVAP